MFRVFFDGHAVEFIGAAGLAHALHECRGLLFLALGRSRVTVFAFGASMGQARAVKSGGNLLGDVDGGV